ncbi:MAG TPA: hypothetical protein VG916_02565 [Gemmatimonadaceae bacterium]|nr:hypothetical protein [Gemmatimonadaceae bacterium]
MPRLGHPPSPRLAVRLSGTLACVAALGACGTRATPIAAAQYTPRTRELTITTVPLLVKEAKKVYPFLDPAFAKGGALDGKEVYAFSPSTLVVAEGDTVHFTIINPEDDVHSFVMPGLVVSLPGNSTQHATYIASHPGIFTITCAVASHLPMMTGQLVVLAGGAVADGTAGAVPAR